jgi:hypothetical protein
MSQYLRVLKRIEGERDASPANPATAKRLQPSKPDTQVGLRESTLPRGSMSPAAAAAFATLFDNLRTVGNGAPIRQLVIAAAAASDSATTVVNGLAAHAESIGLEVVVAEMSYAAGRPVLRRRNAAGNEPGVFADPPPFELLDPDWQRDFADWFAKATPNADMVIIEGPPLVQSVDGALVGRACDGLVLVAELLVTPRDALRVAAERARAVGCRALGVVLTAGNDPVPQWLRRLVGTDRQPPVSSEK